LPKIKIMAILVRGNSQVLTLISQGGGYIGGFRRKGKVKDSLTSDEITTYLAGQKAQYDVIMARYRECVPKTLQYSHGTHRSSTVSALFVSALPVRFFRTGSFRTDLRNLASNLDTLPGYFKCKEDGQFGSLLKLNYSEPASAPTAINHNDNKLDISVYAFGNGYYLIQTWFKDGFFEPRINTLLVAIGLYTTLALSNMADETTRWAIQGRLARTPNTRSVAIDPIMFQSTHSLESDERFSSVRNVEGISAGTINTLRDIFGLIDQDFNDLFNLPDSLILEGEQLSIVKKSIHNLFSNPAHLSTP
jgi:hypothetical protein